MSELPLVLTEPILNKGVLFGDVEQPLIGIYEESSDQKYRIGTQLRYNDGRIFRYGEVGGTNILKALMMQSAVMESKITAITQAGTTQSVGDREITILITTGVTLAEDKLTDGHLSVDSGDAAAIGDMYRILASKVGADDTELTLLLETSIRTALTASAVLTCTKNRWRDVVVVPHASGVTAPAAGVPLIDMTKDYFGWFQTGGNTPLIVDTGEDIVEGDPVGEPATYAVDGACGVQVTLLDRWGICIHDAAADAAAQVWLTIDK